MIYDIEHTLCYNSLLKLIIKRCVDGKTGRERPRMEYISQIMKNMDIGSYRDLKELSFDRKAWRIAANQWRD